jgi:hypothetical protein
MRAYMLLATVVLFCAWTLGQADGQQNTSPRKAEAGAEGYLLPDLGPADGQLPAPTTAEPSETRTKPPETGVARQLPVVKKTDGGAATIGDTPCVSLCDECCCEPNFWHPSTWFRRHVRCEQSCDTCCQPSCLCRLCNWLTYRTHACSCCRWRRSPCCTPPLYTYFLCLDGCVHYGPCPCCPPPGNPCDHCNKDAPAAGPHPSLPNGAKTTASDGGKPEARDSFKHDPLTGDSRVP